jgi:hypothetical protein
MTYKILLIKKLENYKINNLKKLKNLYKIHQVLNNMINRMKINKVELVKYLKIIIKILFNFQKIQVKICLIWRV